MRVAIVGAGTMGRRHAGVVLRNGRCRLAVVVDIHRERAATVAVEAGCLATDRLEPALACDVAVIATRQTVTPRPPLPSWRRESPCSSRSRWPRT